MGVGLYTYILCFLSFFVFSQNSFHLNANQQNLYIDKTLDPDDLHIVFLLPFCVEQDSLLFSFNIDSLIMNPDPLKDHYLYKKTQISIDFLHGFLLSLRQFKEMEIKVSIFDIKEGDVAKNILDDILQKDLLNDVDLIIGPLFTENFIFFTNRLDQETPVISPFSKKKHIPYANEYAFQVPVPIDHQLSLLAQHIFNTHKNDNILLIKRDTILDTLSRRIIGTEDYEIVIDTLIPDDIIYGDIFLSTLKDVLVSHSDSLSFKEVKVPANVIDSIHHELDTLGMSNIIIISSDNDVFVTDLLSKLHACRDTSMIVYGLPELTDFNHISVYDLMDMRLTFPHNKNVNYSEVNQFIIDFHNYYNYVPNLKYASVGYELGMYFSNLLFYYGEILPYLDYYGPQNILGTTYDFIKLKDGGYQNQATSILRYSDFGYEKLQMQLE